MKTTRCLVIELVDLAIEETPGLTATEAAKLRATARTIDRISLNSWWSEELDCGCVATTAFSIFDENPQGLISRAVWKFGLTFDKHLRHMFDKDDADQVELVEVEE